MRDTGTRRINTSTEYPMFTVAAYCTVLIALFVVGIVRESL